MKTVYWKHHVAFHFVDDPTLTKNNGVEKGGDVFSDFGFMVKTIGCDKYYIAPILMDEEDLIDNKDETYRSKINKKSIGDFAPVKTWMGKIPYINPQKEEK